MISTADLNELKQLISTDISDPHHILGMHEVLVNGKKCLSVRVFIPQAKEVVLIDASCEEKTYPFEKIHTEGFFECLIKKRTKWFNYKLQITNHENETWYAYDPYSFLPVISDLDMYLFGEGTHYSIYEKLGAHPLKINGIEGVLFAVWAPNAKRVSVIGDFNMWDGRRNPMRLLQNSGIWEIFIPGIKVFDKYKFELKVPSGLIYEKTDPFENFQELRPSHASLVVNLNEHNWKDSKWMKTRQNKSPLDGPMNVYEVHLGSFKRVEEEENRFLSYIEFAREIIPYVKEMGYTHIELLPIMEHPFDGSWGYQVTGYYAPTSRFGTPEEFMEMIDLLHQNNIGIILDWVPAHFPKDIHALAKFDSSSLYEHEDFRRGEHLEWGTLIFNFGRREVKNFLIANAIYWIEKYHIDGIRVDAVASMLYLDYCKSYGQWIPNEYGGNVDFEAVEFIKHLNSVIQEKFPNVLMIAEESTSWDGVTRNVNEDGLGFSLKWNMGFMNDILLYMTKDHIYRKHHHSCLTFGMMYAYKEKYISVLSHDEVVHGKGSLVNKMPGDYWQKFANLRLLYGFSIGHPGKKLLFMGGEFGQFSEWWEERSLDWFLLDFDKHKEMNQYVKDLNTLYLQDTPLWFDDFCGKGFEWIDCNDSERSIVSFFRIGKKKKDITVFVCNFTPATHLGYRLGVPYKGTYKEILNSDNKIYGGSGVCNHFEKTSEEIKWHERNESILIDLPPLGVAVFKLV